MSVRLRMALSAVVFPLIMLFASSGCDFSAWAISSADSPDVVLDGFIHSLKDKDFESADQFLANGASVILSNKTCDTFFDCYVDISLRNLTCVPLVPPAITGTTAVIEKVKISVTDKNEFIPWLQNHLSRIEHDYMLKYSINEFDRSDKNAVSEVLTMAMKEYEKNAGLKSDIIKVEFVFSDKQWKIIVSDDLIALFFGVEHSIVPQDNLSDYVNHVITTIASQTSEAEDIKTLPYDRSTPATPPSSANFYEKDGKICYKDSTIEVVCWKETSDPFNAEVCFADITIKHPSQFRRQWAFAEDKPIDYKFPTDLFRGTNGIIGMSSDFYIFRMFGIEIQYGKVLWDKRSDNPRQKYLEVLVVDYNGDFHIWKDNELSDYINKNGTDDIMHSFTFGPALIENGKIYDSSNEINYPLGEPLSSFGRAAIGQLGKLHYLYCTFGDPGIFREDMARVMQKKGCITAYNLDGGQTGTIVMNNRVFNKISFRDQQRDMSDIIYFCSAE